MKTDFRCREQKLSYRKHARIAKIKTNWIVIWDHDGDDGAETYSYEDEYEAMKHYNSLISDDKFLPLSDVYLCKVVKGKEIR